MSTPDKPQTPKEVQVLQERRNNRGTIPVDSLAPMMDEDKSGKVSILNKIRNDKDIVNLFEHESMVSGNQNRIVLELLPDLHALADIITASCLNTNSFTENAMQITFDLDQANPGELSEANKVIQKHFLDTLNLKQDLSTQVKDIMFLDGSKTAIIWPESVMSEIIRSSSNSIFKSKNFKAGLESFKETPKTSFYKTKETDKLLLDFSNDINQINKEWISNELTFQGTQEQSLYGSYPGLESFENDINNPAGFMHLVGRRGKKDGYPRVQYLRSDCIIPIFGSDDQYLGCYLALDPKTGKPISRIKDSNQFMMLDKNDSKELDKLKQTAGMLGIQIHQEQAKEPKDMKQTLRYNYECLVEDHLIKSFKEQAKAKGVNSLTDITVNNPSEVLGLLLERAFVKKRTSLIFIDKDISTYFAVERDSNGLGVSLLQRSHMYSNFRIQLLVAKLLNKLKNSSGITQLNIELDEDEADPEKTIDTIVSNFYNRNKGFRPQQITQIDKVFEAANMAGLAISINAGEGTSKTKAEIEYRERGLPDIDSDLEEELKKAQYSSYGAKPEIIDTALEGDTATSVNNAISMFGLNIARYQMKLEPQYEEFFQKYLLWSNKLSKAVKDCFKTGNISYADIVQSLTVSLPRPTGNAIENYTDTFDKVKTMFEESVEAIYGDDLLESLSDSGFTQDRLTSLRKAIVSDCLAKWLVDHGIATDIIDVSVNKQTGKDFIRYTKNRIKWLASASSVISKYLTQLDFKNENKIEQMLEKLENGEEVEEEGDESTPTESTDSNGNDSGADSTDDSDSDDTSTDGDDTGDAVEEETPEEDSGDEEEFPEGF